VHGSSDHRAMDRDAEAGGVGTTVGRRCPWEPGRMGSLEAQRRCGDATVGQMVA
jgi:hypothetical protein